MSLDYTAYFDGSKEQLSSGVDAFLAEVDGETLFEAHGVEAVDRFTRTILSEEGFPSTFQSSAWFRLRKDNVVAATDSLKLLRDRYLGPSASLVLMNGDTRLPD